MTRAALTMLGISVLTFAVCAVGYFFWYQAVTTLSAHAAALSTQVQEKNAEVSRITDANAAFASLASDEALIRQYFVSDNAVVPFLAELQKRGASLGGHVEIVSVSAETNGVAPHLSISLKIDGSFNAVMRTLGVLEYGARDIVVNDLSLTSSASDKGDTKWSAVAAITVGTHPAAAGAPATTTTATTTP